MGTGTAGWESQVTCPGRKLLPPRLGRVGRRQCAALEGPKGMPTPPLGAPEELISSWACSQEMF